MIEWLSDPWVVLAVFAPVAYLIGSVPFGVLIARSRGVDLRNVGSGNVGATNVGRTLGAAWGSLCFVLDVSKGLGPVLLAGWFLRRQGNFPAMLHQIAWLGVGLGAILGHVFSLYLHFRGGKGVATALGVVLGIWPYFTYPGLCALGLWILVTLLSRYVSLGSVIAALGFLPLFAIFHWPVGRLWPLGGFAALMVILILVRHRGNMRRLLAGTENKIGARKQTA